MTQVRDFLDRFRPAGAPGSAARAGVPADRAREEAAELDPVLVLLEGAQAECERIVAAAHAEAERIGDQARLQAQAVADGARRRSQAARDAAVSEVAEQTRAQARQAAAAARSQAARIRRRARARIPGLAAQAVDLVRTGAGLWSDSAAPAALSEREPSGGPGGGSGGRGGHAASRGGHAASRAEPPA